MEQIKLQVPLTELSILARSNPVPKSISTNLIIGSLPLASTSFPSTSHDGTQVEEQDEKAPAKKKKKIRGPKGPNPLSIKKKLGPAPGEMEKKRLEGLVGSNSVRGVKRAAGGGGGGGETEGEGKRKRKRG